MANKNNNTKSSKKETSSKKLVRIANTTTSFLNFMGLGRNAEGNPISLHKDENGKTDRYKVVFVAFPQDEDSDLAPNNMHFVVSAKTLNALKDAGFNAKDYGKGKTSCLAKPVYLTQSVLTEDGLTTTQTYNTLIDITVLEKDEDGEWKARTILSEEEKKKKSTKKSDNKKSSTSSKKSTKKVEDDEDEAEEDDDDEVIENDEDEDEEEPF